MPTLELESVDKGAKRWQVKGEMCGERRTHECRLEEGERT